VDMETRKVCLQTVVQHKLPIISYDQFSNFSRLKRVTAYVFRFIKGCWRKERKSSTLTVDELNCTGSPWPNKITSLRKFKR
jgi:hypothetical protein